MDVSPQIQTHLPAQQGGTVVNASACDIKKFIKRVGIIVMPSGPIKKKKGSAYITKNNIDWFDARGVEVIPIPYNASPATIRYYFKRINGLYMQGGPGYDISYIKTCKYFLKLAVDANKRGDYFPVWGTCHGFQMFIMLFGRMYPMDDLDAQNSYMSHVVFTEDAVKSRLYRSFPMELLEYMTQPKHIFFSHRYGVKTNTFYENPYLPKLFRALTTSKDRKGVSYISTIEARDFPFYGVQFHPERQPVMEPFKDFLVGELLKNEHELLPIDWKHRMLEKKTPCPESKQFHELYKIQRCATRRNPKFHRIFQASGCVFFDIK